MVMLTDIANDAISRGWEIKWAECDARTELLIFPTLSDPDHTGMFQIGLGNRLGNQGIACWIYSAYNGALILPAPQEQVDMTSEFYLCPEVTCLEDALQVFDRVMRDHLADMRRIDETNQQDWQDIEPLAEGRQ